MNQDQFDAYIGMQQEITRLRARVRELEENEPIAWRSLTPAYIQYITHSRYLKFRPAYQKWYEPICRKCENVSRAADLNRCTDTPS